VGGRRRLRAGAPRLLGRHDGVDGRAYRRAWAALVAEYGQPAPGSLVRLEMGRAAVAWVNLQASTHALAAARRRRRRPSARDLERLRRRHGLDDLTYSGALGRLREQARPRPRTADEIFAELDAEVAANRAREERAIAAGDDRG
jgi:hypothetical protein